MGNEKRFTVLTVSDMGVATGFARVMQSVVQDFPEEWDIHSLAINYRGDPYESRSKLYPAMLGGDPYGFGRLGNLVDSIDPDRIFILQDSWIIKRYLEILEDHLDKVVLYVPVDAGPYMPEWLENFPKVKQVCVYTEFGKSVLQDANPEITNITIVPHGVSREIFKPLDRLETREMFKSITPEHFVFLNVNRNQPRKRIDIAFKAFGIFSRGKDDVKYYHHGGIKDAGIDVVAMAKRCGITEKLILTSRNLSPQNYVSDEVLNKIYNIGDIGINSSTGEGWGLCLVENTEILTSTGFKKIQNIDIGNSVYDKDGKLTKVTKLYSREIDTDIQRVKVSGHCEPLLITKEHPVLANGDFVAAGNLVVGDSLYRPTIQGLSSFSKLNLTHYAHFSYIDDYIYFETYKKNLGSKIIKKELDPVRRLFNTYIPANKIRKINKYIKIDEHLAALMVYLLSRPHMNTKRFTNEPAVAEALYSMFGYHKNPGETYLNLDKNIIQALINITKSQTIYLNMPNQLLRKFLNDFIEKRGYTHPVNKRLVVAAKSLWKKRIIRLILDRLGIARSEFKIKGDGTVYFSLDKSYLYKFQTGNVTRNSRNRTEDISGFEYGVLSTESVPYAGTVYNFETENHTYTANEFVVHNCNVEHGMTGHPQIVGNHSANKEIYADDRGLLVPINHYDTSMELMTEGAVVSPEDLAKSMEYAYTHREEMLLMGEKFREYLLLPQFDWKNISRKFAEILE